MGMVYASAVDSAAVALTCDATEQSARIKREFWSYSHFLPNLGLDLLLCVSTFSSLSVWLKVIPKQLT